MSVMARDVMTAHRWWWETWWCVVLAIAVAALPTLLVASSGHTYRSALATVIAATAMPWLSRLLHGRVQPGVYFALPFAALPVLAVAVPGFALWISMARWARLRAGLFAVAATAACAVWPAGCLALVAAIFAAEVARARAVETDGAWRRWVKSIGHATYHALPLMPAALVSAWRSGNADFASTWLSSLARKPGWMFGALGGRWPLLDIGSVIVVALVIDRSYRDRRFRYAPMLVAAALGLLVVFVMWPRDIGLGGGAIVFALLSIRCSAWVKRRRRAMFAYAAIVFLLARAVGGIVGAVIPPDDVLTLSPARTAR